MCKNEYIEKLENLYSECYSNNGCCKWYENCKSEIKYSKCKQVDDKFLFDRARIGKLYGCCDIPRVVIIGIEGFSDEKIISTYSEPSTEAVNSHYCGVKYIISYLLADFLKKEKPTKVTKKGVYWVEEALKRYTLCNLYRCAFVPSDDPDRIKGLKHSEQMKKNCFEILLRELEILEPDIIVIQAIENSVFSENMRNELNYRFNISWDLNMCTDHAKIGYGKYKSKTISFLNTLHGAYGGFRSHEYLKNKLNPILNKAITTYMEYKK